MYTGRRDLTYLTTYVRFRQTQWELQELAHSQARYSLIQEGDGVTVQSDHERQIR
jgi:hypothetical protein